MTAGFGWMGEINDELNSFLGVTSQVFNPAKSFQPSILIRDRLEISLRGGA